MQNVGPTLGAMATKFRLGVEIQSPAGLFVGWLVRLDVIRPTAALAGRRTAGGSTSQWHCKRLAEVCATGLGWCSGYGVRLVIERSPVRLPVYTGRSIAA